MVYRICGGITFLLIAIDNFGYSIPPLVIAIFALLAGIGLLAGI
jgi:hypothetical protein